MPEAEAESESEPEELGSELMDSPDEEKNTSSDASDASDAEEGEEQGQSSLAEATEKTESFPEKTKGHSAAESDFEQIELPAAKA